MFCPYCGTKVRNKRFCHVCGASSTGALRGEIVSPKNQWVAFALCVFLGYFGVHRFYVGKNITGIFYFFSGGGFLIGWLLDIYFIAIGTFKDRANLPLKKESTQPPPGYIQSFDNSVKQMVAPIADKAQQIKRVFVPDKATEPIPRHNIPVRPTPAPPASPAPTPPPAPPAPPPQKPTLKPDIGTPIGRCAQAVLDYLQNNDSTPFFRDKLHAIATKLVSFSKRSGAAREVIIERFGSSGLTYNKFTAPIAALEEHSIRTVDSLVSKMKLFDEEDCKRRAQELLAADKYKEMQEYIALESNYKDSVEKTLSTLEDALLKLEKLIYEMSKLGDVGLDQATHVLDGIEELIRDTPHYGRAI
jgi:polyhydroxyalkanoate synthesis regulator phasin